MGELILLDRSGDTRTQWNPANAEETQIAREAFEAHRKLGYLAYRVTGARGERGDQMHEFDPHAGAVILTPPLRGG